MRQPCLPRLHAYADLEAIFYVAEVIRTSTAATVRQKNAAVLLQKSVSTYWRAQSAITAKAIWLRYEDFLECLTPT
jgi:hypothetical protein